MTDPLALRSLIPKSDSYELAKRIFSQRYQGGELKLAVEMAHQFLEAVLARSEEPKLDMILRNGKAVMGDEEPRS